METSKSENLKKEKTLKSSWGGFRPGAGRKRNVPPSDMGFGGIVCLPEMMCEPQYEIVEDLQPEIKLKKRRASQNRPLTEEDKLWNKAVDGGVKEISRFLNATLGRVR